MAENDAGSEKTEQPTAKRLSEAREKGQIPRSVDLNAALGLLAGMLLLWMLGTGIMERLVGFTRHSFDYLIETQMSLGWFLGTCPEWIWLTLVIVAPFMAVLSILVLASSLLQVGFNWTTKPLTEPDFKKIINIVPGIVKIFKRDNWVRLLMALAKTVIVMLVAWSVIMKYVDTIYMLGAHSLGTLFDVSMSMSLELGLKMALAMLILAFLDWQYQKFTTNESLKMTKDEIKEETKSLEGDPKVRQRRRSIQMRMARERMMKSVSEADVVVTNPVELAVAIRYDENKMDAPVVVAKGARLMAARIKEIAAINEVPVIEHKPMARALYEAVEVGEMIPDRLFKGVAEILAYVWEANTRRKQRAS